MKQSRYSWLSCGYMMVMCFLQWWNQKFWRSWSIAPHRHPKQKKNKKIRILTKVFFTSVPNLQVIVWLDDELWWGQAPNWENLDLQDKFDLEGQGRSLHKTIGILTKIFYTSKPNLVKINKKETIKKCGHPLSWLDANYLTSFLAE